VVTGAGIGGLAAAAGLCAAGWDVTACERARSLKPAGLPRHWLPTGCALWHEPIPGLLAVISWLAAGTGPDAVTGMLARYTAARLPRTTDAARPGNGG
jgi:cation diffusion facilitator CzcD-associated flavoprotein CzcO